ncbi:CHAT domain-containing protein [Cellulomonas humilata]|uniref:CHAT domain-containing protein n=1 Tax=Cellulomonas humilata TaxID=144055 RepID=A0A7Y6DYB6_9CELL|nr:CHAT domain-containing protein [Cellulomonas humilata]
MSRAGDLYAAGVAANEDMRPAAGARLLRAALRALGDPEQDDEEARTLRGRVSVSLAMAEAEAGRLATGLELLATAAGLLPAQERAIAHAQRAILLRRAGRDEESLAEYAVALASLDVDSQPVLVAKVLVNRAVVHMGAARLGPARADLDLCLTLARREGAEVLVAKAVHDLGFLDYVAGDLPSALRRYVEAERLYEGLLPGILAMLGLDRGRVLVAAGLVTEAERELGAAVASLREQGSLQDAAEGELARAAAALLDGRPADARRLARAARTVFRRRGNARWAARAELMDLRGAAAGARTRVGTARRAEELHEVLASLGMREDARVAALVAARAHAAAGRSPEARRLVEVTGMRGAGLETRLLQRAARADVAAADGHVQVAARERRSGLTTLHRARALLGALDLQGGAAVLGRELAGAGLADALATGRAADVFTWAELARAQAMLTRPAVLGDEDHGAWQDLRALGVALGRAELDGRPTAELRTRRAALARDLRRRTWAAPGTGVSHRPASLSRVQAALDGAAMVVYLQHEGVLRALVLTRTRASLVALGPLGVAHEATSRVRADLDVLAGALPAGLDVGVRAARGADAAALSALVLDPVLSLVGDRDLVVVPTGGLLTVPWAALAATRGRAVTVAVSATSWVDRVGAAPVAPTGATVLVAGPGTTRGDAEVATVAELVRAAGLVPQVLLGDTATVGRARAALAGAGVVHVAAHGRHEADNPLFSSLELADGPLMGYDLLRLPRPPQLVVLSCCDLGLHDTRPGDESLGTASALLASGARTVVASVAREADEVALPLMVDLHRRLVAGERPAAALAAAGSAAATGFVCFGSG